MALVRKRSLLKVWSDVIFAIFLREIKSKFNDKLGIIWSVISPVAFIMMLSFIRGVIEGGDTHTIPTFFFMMYGMLFIQLFIGTFNSVSSAIQKNKPLYAFRQVQPISSIFAIGFFELIIKFFVILVIAFITFIMKFDIQIQDGLSIILNFIKVWLITISVGMITGLFSCFVPEIKKIQGLAIRPLFFISGVFFSLQDVSREYWHYLNWNPLLHAVELTRYAAYPSYGNEGVSYFYLDLFTLTSVFLALACYHISWKQAISR